MPQLRPAAVKSINTKIKRPTALGSWKPPPCALTGAPSPDRRRAQPHAHGLCLAPHPPPHRPRKRPHTAESNCTLCTSDEQGSHGVFSLASLKHPQERAHRLRTRIRRPSLSRARPRPSEDISPAPKSNSELTKPWSTRRAGSSHHL